MFYLLSTYFNNALIETPAAFPSSPGKHGRLQAYGAPRKLSDSMININFPAGLHFVSEIIAPVSQPSGLSHNPATQGYT